MPNPTAVQSVVVAQEMPFKPLTSAGRFCACHAYPAFEENNTSLTPATKQIALVGHDAERRRLVPDGSVSSVHESPPEFVLMRVEPAPVFPVLPTATQSSNVEQETPVKSTALEGGD
jgi:hypothetical protein